MFNGYDGYGSRMSYNMLLWKLYTQRYTEIAPRHAAFGVGSVNVAHPQPHAL